MACCPQWNDCDGGKLLAFGEAALDARPTLSAAVAAFGEAFGDGVAARRGSAGSDTRHPPSTEPAATRS